ncbi:MAG: polyketide cyclase, partial [Nitrososphaeria archaeon]|nr:polyketide cyclase [Nitrososphaeria archaeon]
MQKPILVGIVIGVFLVGLGVGYAVFSANQSAAADLEKYKAAESIAAENIKTFDTLDFDVFTN